MIVLSNASQLIIYNKLMMIFITTYNNPKRDCNKEFFLINQKRKLNQIIRIQIITFNLIKNMMVIHEHEQSKKVG